MANTLLTISLITREALRVLENNLTLMWRPLLVITGFTRCELGKPPMRTIPNEAPIAGERVTTIPEMEVGAKRLRSAAHPNWLFGWRDGLDYRASGSSSEVSGRGVANRVEGIRHEVGQPSVILLDVLPA